MCLRPEAKIYIHVCLLMLPLVMIANQSNRCLHPCSLVSPLATPSRGAALLAGCRAARRTGQDRKGRLTWKPLYPEPGCQCSSLCTCHFRGECPMWGLSCLPEGSGLKAMGGGGRGPPGRPGTADPRLLQTLFDPGSREGRSMVSSCTHAGHFRLWSNWLMRC